MNFGAWKLPSNNAVSEVRKQQYGPAFLGLEAPEAHYPGVLLNEIQYGEIQSLGVECYFSYTCEGQKPPADCRLIPLSEKNNRESLAVVRPNGRVEIRSTQVVEAR